MPLKLSEATVPVFDLILSHMSETLTKAEHYAATHRYEPEALLNDRLFPDMWPLSRQVQQFTAFIIRGMARILDLPVPTLDDSKISFPALHDRIAEVIAFLDGLDPAAIDAADQNEVTFPVGHGHGHKTLPAWQYLQHVMLPNIHFHTTTAYNILRTNGVPLKKDDFTGAV
ncbi:MAG: DUF1993 domain-containing protein [Bauldia sp.]|nr:DUF1993 domain-containing protein [Bauldia sp.]